MVRPTVDVPMIQSRIKRAWGRRHEPLTRALIRAYLNERKSKTMGSPGGITEMGELVARYWKPFEDDYVIYPSMLRYLKIMALDTDFNNEYGP